MQQYVTSSRSKTHEKKCDPNFIVGTTKNWYDLPKIESLGGWERRLTKFFPRKVGEGGGGKPEKGGVDVEMGVATFFITLHFSSITFTVYEEKVRFPLLLFVSSFF